MLIWFAVLVGTWLKVTVHAVDYCGRADNTCRISPAALPLLLPRYNSVVRVRLDGELFRLSKLGEHRGSAEGNAGVLQHYRLHSLRPYAKYQRRELSATIIVKKTFTEAMMPDIFKRERVTLFVTPERPGFLCLSMRVNCELSWQYCLLG